MEKLIELIRDFIIGARHKNVHIMYITNNKLENVMEKVPEYRLPQIHNLCYYMHF
jgi:hypothetical protein